MNVLPASDSFALYDGAHNILKGNFNVIDNKSCIGEYPHNLGYMFYYLLFFKLFGYNNSVLTYMRIVNLILSIFTYVYIYRITDILYSNNKINLMVLLLFVGFNHFILYSAFLYTNVIGYSFAIFSIYYLIAYVKSNKRIVLSLLFIIISICFRKKLLNCADCRNNYYIKITSWFWFYRW